MKYIYSLFFIFILFGLNAYSQNKKKVTPIVQPTAAFAPQDNNDEEVAALKAQLDVMKDYNGKILNNVYFALGGAACVVLIVLGLSWYTNSRVYNRDIDLLKKDIISLLVARTTIEVNEAVDVKMKSALYELNTIRFNLLRNEYQEVEKIPVPSNMLNYSVDMLELALEMENEYRINESFNLIKKSITPKVLTYNSSKYVTLLRMSEKIPKEFNSDFEDVKALFKKAEDKREEIKI